MATQNKVSLSNQSDLKNASDDAIANYLNSIGFTQKHGMTDVRLAIGYGSFVIAAACALWDYKLGFENTKIYTAVAVAIYTLLQGALVLWMGLVEAGTVYQGIAPSGEEILVATNSTTKNGPTYMLKITITGGNGETAKKRVIEISRSYTEWFNEKGFLVPTPFQELLASSIPVVGKADPKRVKTASQKMLDDNPDLLEAVLAASSEAQATGAEKKSGGKRRKA